MISHPRRRFLLSGAAAAAAVTAGCLDDPAGDDAGRTLSLSIARRGSSLSDRHVVELSDTRPPWSADAFEAALDGSAYTTQYRKPFFSTPDDPAYTERDGTYYRLGSVVVGEASEIRPVLRLRDPDPDPDSNSDPDTDGDGSAAGTDADGLPDGDQRAVRIAHMAARARGNEGGVPWGLVERGGYVYRRDDTIEASRVLADDGPEYVVYRDTRYAAETSRERVHEPVYRATVEPVATDAAGMEAVLRAQFVDARVDRDELSTDAQEVLRVARGDGYDEAHPYSAGYRELLTALHERAFLDGNSRKDATTDGHGRGILAYGDVYLEYRLRLDPDSG